MKNNLRYYQVGFVGRSSSMKNRKELTYCAVDLLCIRENCYEPLKGFDGKDKDIRIFKHGTLGIHEKEKEKVLVVILEPRKIEVAISMIKTLPGRCKVYVFSPGHYAFDDEFEEVAEKIELCALPEAILQAYNKVLPKAKRNLVAELEKGALEE
jgi:adenine-specific DNA-methyltransferase